MHGLRPHSVSSPILQWRGWHWPCHWRGRIGRAAASILRWFATGVALLFGACALTLLFYESAINRYEVDFLPALLLLAVVGILGLERGLVDRPAWRRVARWGWGLLLVFSVAFNLLASVVHYAKVEDEAGTAFLQVGKLQEAAERYQHALRLNPDYADAHYNLGIVLLRAGRFQDAIGHFEQALQIKPDYAKAHNNLGIALCQLDRIQDAIGHFEQALRIKPDFAEAHYNLGVALERAGKLKEAITHYEQAVRIDPDLPGAQTALSRLQAGQ